ncbi:hypothetical protein ACFLU5_03080 [Bacteroidota bacterium]
MYMVNFLMIFSLSVIFGSCNDSFEKQPILIPDKPELPENPTGSQIADHLKYFRIEDQEQIIYSQVENRNIPEFLEEMYPVPIQQRIDSLDYNLILYVLPDYLALGENDDYFYMSIRPGLAQAIAELWDCSLPTKKIVDEIHNAAPVKLNPQPMNPDESMTTIPVFYEHTEIIVKQKDSLVSTYPLGTLTAGSKKDVVITNKLTGEDITKKVAIYGWHYPDGTPIQPLYTGHSKDWVDYSHGVRFISNKAVLNDDTITLQSIMKDPVLSILISDEGVVDMLKYPATSYD